MFAEVVVANFRQVSSQTHVQLLFESTRVFAVIVRMRVTVIDCDGDGTGLPQPVSQADIC